MKSSSSTHESDRILFGEIHQAAIAAGGTLAKDGEDLAGDLAVQLTEKIGEVVAPNGVRNAILYGLEGGYISCSVGGGNFFGEIIGIKVVENS